MTGSYKALWSHGFVADEDLPKLPADAEWRKVMVRARKEHGLTQAELGKKVGVSQALISKIEDGTYESSDAIRSICDVLSIPEPAAFANEDDRAWIQLGRLLRSKNMEQYRRALSLVESMVGPSEDTKDEPEERPASQPRPK